jgi:hypothetical protein
MFGSNRRRNDLFVAIAVRCNYVQLIFLLRSDRFFPIARIRSDNRLLFAFVVDVSYHQHYSKEHDENYNHGHNLLLLCNGAFTAVRSMVADAISRVKVKQDLRRYKGNGLVIRPSFWEPARIRFRLFDALSVSNQARTSWHSPACTCIQ